MCNRRHRHNTTTNTHTSAHSEDVALRFKLPFFHIHSVTLVSYRSIPNSISSICEWFFVVVVLFRSIVRSLYILVYELVWFVRLAQIFRFHAVVVVVCFCPCAIVHSENTLSIEKFARAQSTSNHLCTIFGNWNCFFLSVVVKLIALCSF